VKPMKHFDISEWTDFARGIASDPNRGVMEAHLDSGCRQCRSTVDLLSRVAVTTRLDRLYEPPAQAVRWAKAISALQSRTRSPLRRLVARLVYDSLCDPTPVGMRAGDRVSRHTLYEAGNFYVDLRLEQEKGSSFATLVGQLTNRQDPESSLAEAPVLLMADKTIVAHAIYNRFGEFQIDYPPSRHLRLCVALDPTTRRIELPLDGLVAEMPKPALPVTKAAEVRSSRRPSHQKQKT
jgi:hypothetical protein